MEEKYFELEIRPEGIVVFDRQNEFVLDDILDILSELDEESIPSVKGFLDGRKRITLISGDEIFCG